jgi:hypothetical protein
LRGIETKRLISIIRMTALLPPFDAHRVSIRFLPYHYANAA